MIDERGEVYSETYYGRYREKREIFQGAESDLTEGMYDALREKLVALGISESTVNGACYQARYGDDQAILTDLAELGINGDAAMTLLHESKAIAVQSLKADILAKRFPEEVVGSTLNYIAAVQRLSNTSAADDKYYDSWARQQMFQLGAAGENCPPQYLAPVLDAVTFLMLTHPEPQADLFHVYKRYSQDSGFIDIRVVVEELIRKGAKPNQVRAILNLHKHYGHQLGTAFLALLKNAPKLMEYEGGVLQLAADFADKGFSPALQEGIVGQADKQIDYRGGALQLAMDLATRQIAAPLQEVIVRNSYFLEAYPGGILKLAEDVAAGCFTEMGQVCVVEGLVNSGAVRRPDAPRYIKNLAKLHVQNPKCIHAQFASGYHRCSNYYDLVVNEASELAALTKDTTAQQLPHLTDEERVHLFCKLLEVVHYSQYGFYRESAFLLAAKAVDWTGETFENSITQLVSLGHGFSGSRITNQPKGSLSQATLLVDDLATIAQSDQCRAKGRWYHELLFQGVDREDAMAVIKVPNTPDWSDRDLTFRPNFEAISARVLSGDATERKQLAPVVGLLLRESFHYYLGVGIAEDDRPIGVICRYVFGQGPEEEGGVTIADIKQCECIFENKMCTQEQFSDYLKTIGKISQSFSVFGERLRLALRESMAEMYRQVIGYSFACETPIEWAVDFLHRDAFQRSSEEAVVLASPSTGVKLPLSLIEEMSKTAVRLAQRYPTQADRFEQFVITLLMRHPAQAPALGGGYTYSKALPGEVQHPLVVAPINKGNDMRQALALARKLEVPAVLANPVTIPELVSTSLTRATALHLGERVEGKAGRMLQILGESMPIVTSGEMLPEDDISVLWRTILESRIANPGYPVMGAKLHVDKAVSTALVTEIMKRLRLTSTSFSTIHAGMTVLLPPGQPVEIKLLLKYLKSKGLFTDRDFDMQVCIGGRLRAKRHEASIGLLNASMLLATQATPSYAVDAWSTKGHNNLTNAYVMAYGDGQRETEHAYNLSTSGDRTDMLGRRDLSDLDLYQIVATLIMHYEDGGYFEDIGARFVNEVVTILQRYDLYDALFDAPWVFEPRVTSRTANTTTEVHWQMVEKFTAMRIVAEDESQKGITGEVRAAISAAYNQSKARFPDIIASDSAQFEKLCTL